jgi:hypothetical protein
LTDAEPEETEHEEDRREEVGRADDGTRERRVDELTEAFSHYANLRETVAENLKAATGLGARNFWRDLLRLLDLAADAAERVEGFSLTPEADEATGEIAAFLR